MQVVAITSPAVFEQAIEAARHVGEGGQLVPGLAAPLEGALQGRLAEAWDAVQSALAQAFRFGVDGSRSALEVAIAKAEEVIAQAGNKATELQKALIARLQEYLRMLVDGALNQVRDSLRVGAQTMHLSSVDINQKIGISGSLKASITEVVAFTSSGELSVVAHYATG